MYSSTAKPAVRSSLAPQPHVVLVDGTLMAFSSFFAHPQLSVRLSAQEIERWQMRALNRNDPGDNFGRNSGAVTQVSQPISGEVLEMKDFPVGALFGLAKVLLKLLSEDAVLASPHVLRDSKSDASEVFGDAGIDYFGVMYDTRPPEGKQAFRKSVLANYKGHRESAPPELYAQLGLLPALCDAMGLYSYGSPEGRWEADDLLATYSRAASEQGFRVSIVTADKDMLQLITEDDDVLHPTGRRKRRIGPVRVYNPFTKRLLHARDAVEKFGVAPRLAPDIQALLGDKGDNIPGIPGMRRAAAVRLVHEHGGLEPLLAKAKKGEVFTEGDAVIEKVVASASDIARNLKLVRLRTTLSVPPLELMRVTSAHRQLYGMEPSPALASGANDDEFSSNDRLAKLEESCLVLLDTFQFRSIRTKLLRSKKRQEQQKQHDDEIITTLALSSESAGSDALAPPRDEVIPLSTEDIQLLKPEGTTIVRDVETARQVVAKLQATAGEERYHAIDTECIHALNKHESVVGHGRVICFSIYCGEDIGRIWVDTLLNDDASICDPCEVRNLPGQRILEEFREYFENPDIKKVFHNYAFDKHMFENHGITIRGFAGDTLLMARLWDSSRLTRGGYSLAALSEACGLGSQKTSMKDIFGRFKERKDGQMGKLLQMPDLHELQRDRETIHDWIYYSVLDTESTWQLRETLEKLLRAMPWKNRQGLVWGSADAPGVLNMWDFYRAEWLPLGELLTEMETLGMKVDVGHLQRIQVDAEQDVQKFRNDFLEWVTDFCPAARWMNIDSDAQKQQLFFAGSSNKNTGEQMPVRTFSVNLADEKELAEFEAWKEEQERIEASARATDDNTTVQETPKKKSSRRSLKVNFEIRGGLTLEPPEFTPSGLPAVGASTIQSLAGDPSEGKYGLLYEWAKNRGLPEEQAIRGCEAVDSLVKAGKISTLLSTFIEPLQVQCDAQSRIHTSLNVNTETGRLSSRNPNLQNQPALEKDTYKVRKCFTCEPGNSLIVADYGQLELRLLAHISACRSMISAFEQGGDFHSRTAIGMYAHIQQAVDAGDVLLEWDYDENEGRPPPVPLVKDSFGSERRKAKTLNFSIAYGKTAHGLAKDWHVSIDEAKETLERWYADRPEVRSWQQATIARARATGYTRTLLGRYRPLPGITSKGKLRGHAERAAINTPLQGGAADIVNRAMVLVRGNQRLQELGWRQVLQIHDELILEGPQESREEALAILVKTMMNPLDEPLLVSLPVDATIAQTWYEGK